METLKSIEERRSIRGFTKEKIKKEIVEDILNCGRLAPSAKNRLCNRTSLMETQTFKII